MPAMPNRFSRLLQAVFWAGLGATVWLSLVPAQTLPQALSGWDKAQHALGFAALTAAGLLAYPRSWLRIAVGLLLFGAGIELAQAAGGIRQGDWLDWLADAVGVLAVWAVGHFGRSRASRARPFG
jgi:VanZ family protein